MLSVWGFSFGMFKVIFNFTSYLNVSLSQLRRANIMLNDILNILKKELTSACFRLNKKKQVGKLVQLRSMI